MPLSDGRREFVTPGDATVHRPLIMLATTALVCGCVASPTVQRTSPPAAEVVLIPAIHAQNADRERIRAEREKALKSTPASMAAECREAFKALHVRGTVDGLTVELARIYLTAFDKSSKDGAEKRELAKAQLFGFCYTAHSIATSNSHRPVVSAGSITLSGPAAARIDDMYQQASCLQRIKDLKDLGVLSDEAIIEVSEYLQERRNPIIRRAGILNGHCAAVNVIWTGLLL